MDGPVTARSEPLRTWPGKTCVIRLSSGVFMAQVRDARRPLADLAAMPVLSCPRRRDASVLPLIAPWVTEWCSAIASVSLSFEKTALAICRGSPFCGHRDDLASPVVSTFLIIPIDGFNPETGSFEKQGQFKSERVASVERNGCLFVKLYWI
jgi:hypothetical protein